MLWPGIRREVHFADRVLSCFAERPRNINALFRAAVARRPHATAIVAGDVRLTYRDLDVAVDRVATGFARCGLSAGERIGLLVGNRPEFAIALLAAARIGLIAVPMNVRQRRPEIAYMLSHCEAAALVCDQTCVSELPPRSEIPAMRAVFVIGDETPAHNEAFAALLQCPPSPTIVHVADEESAFCILYTSGTTGSPKGAILTHMGVVHSVLHYEHGLGLREGEVAMLAVPVSHVTGLIAILLSMLHVAGTTIMMESFRARTFLETVERERAGYTLMVPAMYNLCLLDRELEKFDLSHWRIGGFGGAPMPVATIERLAVTLPDLSLVNVYGATETSSPVSIMSAGGSAHRRDSVGRILPCADIIVVDEQGREVPVGERGELLIAGPMVIPGYWNKPADKASFIGGYWRSGDIGSVDGDGHLRIHDRLKDIINRGGYKIYCVEVENVIAEYPGVVECAVVGSHDDVLGERVHAFVFAGGGTIDKDDMRAFCAARLSDYKVPEHIVLAQAALPRNANGKILKDALRRQNAYAA